MMNDAGNSNDSIASPSSHNGLKNRARIIVPTRICQGGFDQKFEDDPYNLDLKGIISHHDYTTSIKNINEWIKPARSKKIDGFLLASSALMVLPLGIWGARRYKQTKSRKKRLKEAIEQFNETHPTLYMRWNRKPQSCLTIEFRFADIHGPPPDSQPGLKEGYFEYN